MTRVALLVAATILLVGCSTTPGTARPRPVAEDTAYCSAVRALNSTLSNSIDKFASDTTLAADANHEAATFDGVAARWRAAGHAQSQLLSSVAANLRHWSAAIASDNNEEANSAVLELWRESKALPPCTG